MHRGDEVCTLGGNSVRVRSDISVVDTVANRWGGSMSRQIIFENNSSMGSTPKPLSDTLQAHLHDYSAFGAYLVHACEGGGRVDLV